MNICFPFSTPEILLKGKIPDGIEENMKNLNNPQRFLFKNYVMSTLEM